MRPFSFPRANPPMLDRLDIRRRSRAAGIHLLISAAVAALAAALVFGVWYPGAYRLLAGGRDLFLLVTSVDVVLGPLLTFTVFNLKKGWPHLRRDLAIIGAIQLLALAYGLHAVYDARPVAMVFEVDRFRVIAANQVLASELETASPEYRALPLSGPWLLGTRKAKGLDESNDALFMGAQGIDLAQRPSFWQPYAASTAAALSHSRPLALLLATYPTHSAAIKNRLREQGVDERTASFLPVMARGGDWVVILDNAGRLMHYVPVDGFF